MLDEREQRWTGPVMRLPLHAVSISHAGAGVAHWRRNTGIDNLAIETTVPDTVCPLDLPRDSFSQRGQLHVWFLRGGRVLWEETVAWPGK